MKIIRRDKIRGRIGMRRVDLDHGLSGGLKGFHERILMWRKGERQEDQPARRMVRTMCISVIMSVRRTMFFS